jgi:acyl CoA:acetate/3-ketoacid CoA transferase alpha subunit
MVFRLGLPVIVLLVGTWWFAWASYRRATLAERALAEVNAENRALMREVRALIQAVAAAEQGLRTLSSHPSVPRDVAVTADLTLADVRRLVERKELDD